MLPKLTTKSFFENFSTFLLQPKEAQKEDKTKALAISILIGIFTLGLTHAITKIYKICHKTPPELGETEQKVRDTFEKNFPPEKNEKKENRSDSLNHEIKRDKIEETEQNVKTQNESLRKDSQLEQSKPTESKRKKTTVQTQQTKVEEQEIPIDETYIRADKMGFKNKPHFHRKFPRISDEKKYEVRDKTYKALLELKFDSAYVSKAYQQVQLFTSPKSKETFTGTQLLGRFDVLAAPIKMDYNYNWDPVEKNKEFFIHHAAAINIGEKIGAEDFKDYSKDGKLDEERYLQDMSQLFFNILSAQEQIGTKKAVWFPFGMGAFLRNLSANDPTYSKETIGQLKFKIAKAFFEQVKKFENIEIHLCLPCITDTTSPASASKIETNQNHNAFLKALKATPEVQDRVQLYINHDATHVAQALANEAENPTDVSLVNGANRNLIGNHWFDKGALVAIDENIHRRSLLAAVMAYGLNGGIKVVEHPSDYLAKMINDKGGKVI